MLELTCPQEEGIDTSNYLKSGKYLHLVADGRASGWTGSIHAFEVGCRGFVAKSTMKLLRDLGFSSSDQRAINEQLGVTVLRCTYFIFCSRNRQQWDNRPLLACNRTQPPDRPAAH